ncbi:FkbM family methyltransferase [Micromonospora sp. NPDC005367]|uniref:FkbM family methyltransferase n=1 Tax=Micromonospora sp. NPDC005367 TaxID=3155590 RepID=UPI0033A02E64
MDARAGAVEALKTDPEAVSIRRSLEVYYGDPAREAAMDAFYARFARPGDLVFDIGAHVGDRVGSFRRLGARVIAVEPQPPCTRALRAIYSGDREVTVVEAVCGAEAGRVSFNVNSANPTISTVSPHFIRAADGAAGWEEERWDARIDVASTTLDELIAEYGVPAFVKIDVEGYEDEVLAGLGRPLPALSFEFTTIERAVAQRCLRRLTALGFQAFNLAVGDTMALASPQWMAAPRMAAYLRSLPYEVNSGDVYCLSRTRNPR